MSSRTTGLVFVYNADGGLLRSLADAVHKTVSPRTYPCSLCALTYGTATMKHAWREYLATLPFPFELLHRDELRATYGPVDAPLPAIFSRTGERLAEVVSAADLDGCPSLEALITLVRTRVARLPS